MMNAKDDRTPMFSFPAMDVEGVRAWWQAHGAHRAVRSIVDPMRIVPLQHHLVAQRIGMQQRDGRILDGHRVLLMGQLQWRLCCIAADGPVRDPFTVTARM